jgi:hypothetical protein
VNTTHEIQSVTRGGGRHFGGQPVGWHRAGRTYVLYAASMRITAEPHADQPNAGMLQLHDAYEAECTPPGGDGSS